MHGQFLPNSVSALSSLLRVAFPRFLPTHSSLTLPAATLGISRYRVSSARPAASLQLLTVNPSQGHEDACDTWRVSNFLNASKYVRSRFLKYSNGQFWTFQWVLVGRCSCIDGLFLAEKIISLYSQVRRLGSVASSLFLYEWWGLNSGTGESGLYC